MILKLTYSLCNDVITNARRDRIYRTELSRENKVSRIHFTLKSMQITYDVKRLRAPKEKEKRRDERKISIGKRNKMLQSWIPRGKEKKRYIPPKDKQSYMFSFFLVIENVSLWKNTSSPFLLFFI